MQLLNEIIINRPHNGKAIIQFLQGDLSAIPREHAADILVISAYPGSYVPVPKTLIAALDNKGLSVDELSKNKATDLRDQLGCWLSQPLSAAQQAQFNFKKILCFEPWHKSTEKAAVVGNIFRCINTFAFSENNNVVAMPILASGKQNVSFEKMLPALLDTSIFWLESGLPLDCIKLVVYSDEQAGFARPIFARARQQNELRQSLRDGNITGKAALESMSKTTQEQLPGEEPMQIVTAEIHELVQKDENKKPADFSPQAIRSDDLEQNRPSFTGPATRSLAPAENNNIIETKPAIAEAPVAVTEYDYFISYAHTHAAVIDAFVKDLTSAKQTLQIFYDKSSIPTGGLWLKQISDALQKSKKILIFLSPDYSNSPVCWDEFQCAKLMEYNSKKQLIQTIYLYNDVAMPPIMGIYSWADGREGDKEKLQKIIGQLLGAPAS